MLLRPADGADALGYATRVAGPSNDTPDAGSERSGRRIFTRERLASVALVLVLIALAAGGGYLLGNDSGADLEAARTAGEKAGWTRGTAIGGDVYPAGLERGRKITYGRTYRDSYRAAYERAFKGSGVDAPKGDEIEVAVP